MCYAVKRLQNAVLLAISQNVTISVNFYDRTFHETVKMYGKVLKLKQMTCRRHRYSPFVIIKMAQNVRVTDVDINDIVLIIPEVTCQLIY